MLDKTFDPAAAEGRLYAAWEASGAFQPQGEGDPFCIMIPPPNVTGSLHIGHALNNTLQDVLARFERMRGRKVLWQPGTDHAGIATQMVVERKLAAEGNADRRSLGRDAFIAKVWEWKAESGGQILNQLKRLGASCDWSRERFTMDEGLSKAVRKVFVELYRQGLIYRDKRLVNWDPHFQTAISDLEVEAKDVKGHMWHFKYPLAGGETYTYVEKDGDGNVLFEEERDYISIATTRPETMLGDGAVAVHPSDARYAPIVGKLCEIPVGPKEHRRLIPIITDEYPDPSFGSGAVKITGAHDQNDYGVAQRNRIPLYRLMDDRARMRADGPAYASSAARAKAIAQTGDFDPAEIDDLNLVPEAYRGLDRYEARKAIIADIDAEGLMVKVEDKVITQPFGDRSGVVIEPMLTDQWYVDAETLAKPAIEAVRSGKTRFVPDTWAKTYYQWMENIEPWCISRQLWWGHRIPAWYGPDGKIFVADDEAGARAAARLHYGKDVALTQDEDVLDTWFSSGLWPFSTLGWPDDTDALKTFYPTTTLVTAFDIIFFWVARMMMQGIHFMGEVPFRDVYIHALVRDEKGQKMSKSKGNVIDPLELVDAYGADALRFTLTAMAAQGRDIKLSASRVEGYRNFSTKLWNAARFMQMNECALLDPGAFDPKALKQTVNRWIVGELAKTARAITAELEAYRFNEAAGAAYRFVWNVFCDWYLELIKPALNGDDEDAKAEARITAGFVLDETLKLLHPFMPFVTEELWARLGDYAAGRERLLIVERWPTYADALIDEGAAKEIDWVIRLITDVRSTRADLNVPPGARIPLKLIGASAEQNHWLEKYQAEIDRLARLEYSVQADAAPLGAVTFVLDGATVALPIANVIDLKAEIARLDKEIGRIEGDVKKLAAKLANPAFVEKAPAEVVEENRERLDEAKTAIAKYRDARAKLAAIG